MNIKEKIMKKYKFTESEKQILKDIPDSKIEECNNILDLDKIIKEIKERRL
jgi:hypothetical protein